MSVNIDLFMTERFEDQWNSNGVNEDPSDELQECKEWLDNQWHDDFRNASFNTYFITFSDTVIPESTLGPLSDLPQRRRDANNWLKNNHCCWDTMSVGIVLDDVDTKANYIGQGSVGGAFSDGQKTGHIDYAHAKERKDTLNWSMPIHNVSYHELGHVFNCDEYHNEGRTYSSKDASVMALQDEYNCENSWYVPEYERKDRYSTCAQEVIEDMISDNL